MCFHGVCRDTTFTFTLPNTTVHRTEHMAWSWPLTSPCAFMVCVGTLPLPSRYLIQLYTELNTWPYPRAHCSRRSCPKDWCRTTETADSVRCNWKRKQLATLPVFTVPWRQQFRPCSCPFIIVTNDFQVWPSPLQGLEWETDASIASMLLQITAGPDVSSLKNGTFSLTICHHSVNTCQFTG